MAAALPRWRACRRKPLSSARSLLTRGAEQCGFCNPGFIMNALALFRENPDPNEEEIKEYLAGNLCRCSGYEGQLRGIQNFLAWKKIKGGCPMKTVNQPVRKKDAMQLVTGQPVYMDDVIPQDCLIVKLLRSPHANAIVKNIDTSRAMLVPGMEVIYTWKDVDQNARRYTQAGQTYPRNEPLRPPCDRPPCPLCRGRCCDPCGQRRNMRR